MPQAVPEGIVLRYGSFYGPGVSMPMIDLVRKRQLPVIGGGTGIWSFCETRDAASATVAAVEHGAPGIYNVADNEPAPVSEWLPYLASVAGRQAAAARARLAWPAAGRASFVVTAMTEQRGSSNAKAKKELGWEPQFGSWREGFRDWVRG